MKLLSENERNFKCKWPNGFSNNRQMPKKLCRVLIFQLKLYFIYLFFFFHFLGVGGVGRGTYLKNISTELGVIQGKTVCFKRIF